MDRCGTASRKSALARIRRRDKHSAEGCRQELTKYAPRSHDWILREPLWTNQQRSHAVVFNSIGELREDFFFSCCGSERRKGEHIGGGPWGAKDVARGASDNSLVIRRRFFNALRESNVSPRYKRSAIRRGGTSATSQYASWFGVTCHT